MEFGFGIPTRGPLAKRDSIARLAERGEALGFTHLAIPDHIVVPRDISSRYPYNESGRFPGTDTGECLEQLTLIAWLAAVTTRARLLTSVMVVPHRNPVHTAKIVATLDVLSQGRIVLGIGAGWMAEEFEAIGTEPFRDRGRVTDEYLEAFKVLWTSETPRHEGEFVNFSDIVFLPKPVQRPHPPIWVGGESTAAMRRTVRHGDAWYPIGTNPRHPFNSLDRLRAGTRKLHALAEEHDRDPNDITLTYWANWYDESKTLTLEDGTRHLFTGNAEAIASDICDLRDLGYHHLLFNFQRDSLEHSLDAMERFARDIIPLAAA